MAGKQVSTASMVHVFSTLANPQRFVVYSKIDPASGMLPQIEHEVLIKGGAGIATKNLLTPHGVHTAITGADYEAIKDLAHFKEFVERGHIRVETKAYDVDKIVGDMNPRDPGGPVTPADYATEVQDGSKPIPTELDKTGTGWVLAR